MAPMALLQDAFVTLVALVAVVILFRRVTGLVRPSSTPGCANCPSAAGSCDVATPAPAPEARPEHPLVFIRPSRP